MIRCIFGSVLFAFLADVAAAQNIENWYSITTSTGEKVGYASRMETPEKNGTKTIHTQTLVPALSLESPRRSVRQLSHFRNEKGDTVRLKISSRGGKSFSKITAKVDGEKINIKRRTRAGTTRYSLLLGSGVYFDDDEAVFSAWNFEKSPVLEYRQFNLAAEAVQRVTLSALPDTSPQSFLMKTFDENALRAMAILERGEDGKVTKLTQPFLSTSLIKTATDKRSALAPGKTPKTGDVIGIKSPYQIPDNALGGTINYQFHFKYGAGFDIPNTSEQRAISKNGKVYVQVCEDCGTAQSLPPASRDLHLAGTPWLQTGNRLISRAANKIRAAEPDDHTVMIELGKWARRKVKDVDFAGHYSAADAIKLGAGDCTEDAVVLAALGRAAGIPTRVVSGLVYSRARYHGVSHVFVSHSWVQAWIDGRWKSYDIAMEKFDASHIVLAIGGGDPALVAAGNSLSGFLDLEVMAQVKPKPGASALP